MKHLSLSEGRKLLQKQGKPSKWRNKRCEYDGIKFQSHRERDRYIDLRVMERLGEISNLRLQVAFDLHVLGKRITEYRADFTYDDKDGEFTVEDAKGAPTPEFLIKEKWMLIEHGIEVKRV